MAVIEVQVPGLGESVTEATIAKWVKKDGDMVASDDVIAELETDKATVEMPATTAGMLKIVSPQGSTVTVGSVIARIDGSAKAAAPVAKAIAVPEKAASEKSTV